MAEPPAKDPRGRGRPSKLTPALQAKVAELLRAGMSRSAVAGAVRVSAAALKEWIARGEGRDPERPRDPEYEAFAAAVHEAEGEFEQSLIKAIKAKATGPFGDWRAAAFLLERRFSESWGKRIAQEITGKDGGPIELAYDFANMTDEQLERVVQGQPPDPGGPGRGGSGA